MRPTTLDEVVGHERWLAPGTAFRRRLDEGRPDSVIFWGPPGCGKTTLARLIARHANLPFRSLSAVLDGVKQLREILDARAPLHPGPTLLFVDEIHRWNKAQQDALLGHVEDGSVVLIGATSENPSIELNPALRSRVRVIQLEPLRREDVVALLRRALTSDHGLARPHQACEPQLLERIADSAAGDARRALTDLERVVQATPPDQVLTVQGAADALARTDLRHDRSGEDHFDVISAFIKSMRGSDPDAALYWLARMLRAGEDPMYIARRLVVFAAEDIGNADPRALNVATDAAAAARMLGMPEARIPLAQATTWLACSPKSNAAYLAIDRALADVDRFGALSVPAPLRQHPPRDAQPYLYPHDHPHRVVAQRHRPPEVERQSYYEPGEQGEEKTIRARLAWWREKLGRS
jgi:putative ATPase